MRLDYKSIITKHYLLHMSGAEIADELNVSKSGVNGFLQAFNRSSEIAFPLPAGITNDGIYALVYSDPEDTRKRDESYELPDYADVHKQMTTRKNMTLVYLWNKYSTACSREGKKAYSYRQFCFRFNTWCDENDVSLVMEAYSGQSMEVDFAGNTLQVVNRQTGEILPVVVFVAILPYSEKIYAEGMISTKEPEWISVNNHALDFFGGVPAIVVPDNCKQAVIANKDWIDPELNKDYAEWAEHNGTAILPAKVKHPRYKNHVEGAVKILEEGLFHILEERQYFSLDDLNEDLWEELDKLNEQPFKNKEHNRNYYWEEEEHDLMPLPSVHYEYTERKMARVSSDFHVRFDNAYYSVDKAYLHKDVLIRATTTTVRIYSRGGEFICEHERARYKGQHVTDVRHLPKHFSSYRSWNGPYFIGQAMEVGQNTVKVIKQVLASRKLEVQTYRLCVGLLGYKDRYSKEVLEECCRRALELNRPYYSFIKNTIGAVADELGVHPDTVSPKEAEPERGGIPRPGRASDLDTLLNRSKSLLDEGHPEDSNTADGKEEA